MHMANTSKYTPSLRTKSSDIFFVSSLYLEIMTKLKVLNKKKGCCGFPQFECSPIAQVKRVIVADVFAKWSDLTKV